MALRSPSPRSATCGLMPIDGAPRRADADRAPKPSPHGRRTATRSPTRRIAAARRTSGSADWGRRDRQLTRLRVAADSPAWSPDDRTSLRSWTAERPAAGRRRQERRHPEDPRSLQRAGTTELVARRHGGRRLVVEGVLDDDSAKATTGAARTARPDRADRWLDPEPNKSIGMREDYGPVWSPDGTQMAAIIDGLLVAWPVGRDGAPTGPPRRLAADLAGSPTGAATRGKSSIRPTAGSSSSTSPHAASFATMTPHLTWTPAAPHYAVSDTGRRTERPSCTPAVSGDGAERRRADATWTSSSRATGSRASRRIARRCTAGR